LDFAKFDMGVASRPQHPYVLLNQKCLTFVETSFWRRPVLLCLTTPRPTETHSCTIENLRTPTLPPEEIEGALPCPKEARTPLRKTPDLAIPIYGECVTQSISTTPWKTLSTRLNSSNSLVARRPPSSTTEELLLSPIVSPPLLLRPLSPSPTPDRVPITRIERDSSADVLESQALPVGTTPEGPRRPAVHGSGTGTADESSSSSSNSRSETPRAHPGCDSDTVGESS
jgi:hypothetical protein